MMPRWRGRKMLVIMHRLIHSRVLRHIILITLWRDILSQRSSCSSLTRVAVCRSFNDWIVCFSRNVQQ